MRRGGMLVLLATAALLAPAPSLAFKVNGPALAKWPDSVFPQPACPDCSRVVCQDALQEADCPPGTFLLPHQTLGCCPACVRYLQYADACPGLGKHGRLNYRGQESKEDHLEGKDWPLNFVEETVELPCSTVSVADVNLQERVRRVSWDEDTGVLVVDSARCGPGLECSMLQYSPDSPWPWDSPDSAVVSPTEDLYPICNPVGGGCPVGQEVCLVQEEGEVQEGRLDCSEWPCLCRKMDYKLWFDAEDCTRHEWNVTCTDTGVFGPLQVRSSRNTALSPHYKWCSDPLGERLFGAARLSVEKMDCGCSRKRWELEQGKVGVMGLQEAVEGRGDISLHCDTSGDWEALQCDLGSCWCVESATGEAVSTVVPEGLVTLLPCYNSFDTDALEANFGAQYLRKCEARAVAVARTQKLLRDHGMSWAPSATFACDPDGSFGPVFQGETESSCRTPENKASNYHVDNGAAAGMNCRCARDQLNDMPGKRTCGANGNYMTLQSGSGKEWCTDSMTGWRLSNAMDVNSKCCLDSSDPPFSPGGAQWGPDRAEFNCKSTPELQAGCSYCQDQMRECITDW